MPQQIFVGTEFTDFKNTKLISIGVVAATGEDFYAEVEYEFEDCSEFVRSTVIPLLNAPFKHNLEVLKILLLSWIDSVRKEGSILIYYDSEYDRVMLEQIFVDGMPASTSLRNLGTKYVNGLMRFDFHVKNKQPEHHALHDARALRYAFRGWLRNVR